MGSDSKPALRVLLYSHDSVGLGHIRRNLALAHALSVQLPALTGRPVTGMLLTGTGHATTLDKPGGFDVVVLPGVAKGDGGYEPRNVDVPMAALSDMREGMLTAAVTGFEPDLVIVDRHAHGVDGELRQALLTLRQERPEAAIVLGLREVLDEPEAVAREWQRIGDLDELTRTFDQIWVYGDASVHDIRRTGELPLSMHSLVRYTGYLANGRRWRRELDPTPMPYVLTMVGGGSDGAELCRIAARADVPEGHRHLVVTGPQMPAAERAGIEALAGPRTRVVGAVPDGLATIRRASAIVSMAGYNTVCEVMSTSTPALLVPREVPRLEQTIRARGLADAGAVDVMRGVELTPERLAGWMRDAVTTRQDRTALALDGLAAVPALAAALVTDTPLFCTPSQEVIDAAV